MQACKNCGASSGNLDFCSLPCQQAFESIDATAPKLRKLDDILFDIFVTHYLETGKDQNIEMACAERAAEKLFEMAFTYGVQRRAKGAAMRDYLPEQQPVTRTPFQERVRAAARKATKSEYQDQYAELRADARGRVLADAVEWWMISKALELAKRGPEVELPPEIAGAYAAEERRRDSH
jgi:hypothetical protein